MTANGCEAEWPSVAAEVDSVLRLHQSPAASQEVVIVRLPTLSMQLCALSLVQAVEEIAAFFRLRCGRPSEQIDNMLEAISELLDGNRLDRQEKRELKRRQKYYRLIQTRRNPNRNRYATAT
ncbi:MAG: hypothetical protein F9B45_29550 [Phycisphaera sp. RhM]|nr:hypothetical protein [Phycisphaera sp. RhM]